MNSEFDDLSGLGVDIDRIRVGDLMRVRRDDGRHERRRVRVAPWKLGNGIWVVGLEGIGGGYALARCAYLEEAPPE